MGRLRRKAHDNLDAARDLILEACIPLQERVVAKGFKYAVDQKPEDPIRATNLMHSVGFMLEGSWVLVNSTYH